LRAFAPACAALAAVLLLPVSAQAVVPARQAPPPRPLATVDHPPVDGVNSFDNGPRSVPRVALTFDADMTPGMLAQLRSGQVRSWYNREVRDILDAEGVHATIFLTGLWAQAYPEVARSMAEDPRLEIGNHSYDHAAFRTPCYGLAGTADRAGEIERAQDQIQAVTGVRPNLLRFPGDCYDRSDVALAQQKGLAVISGDVRSGDAFNNSAPAVAAVVLRNLKPGSIVLMHIHGGPNAPMTAPALRMVIQGARARGLDFGTVSEVLGRTAARIPRPAPTAEELLRPLRALKLEAPAAPASRPDRSLSPYRQLRLEGPRRVLWGFPGHLVQ
jgi:peptidoglycan/xylan/chitin deacetylase (PgdA/CDA1 family)